MAIQETEKTTTPPVSRPHQKRVEEKQEKIQ